MDNYDIKDAFIKAVDDLYRASMVHWLKLQMANLAAALGKEWETRGSEAVRVHIVNFRRWYQGQMVPKEGNRDLLFLWMESLRVELENKSRSARFEPRPFDDFQPTEPVRRSAGLIGALREAGAGPEGLALIDLLLLRFCEAQSCVEPAKLPCRLDEMAWSEYARVMGWASVVEGGNIPPDESMKALLPGLFGSRSTKEEVCRVARERFRETWERLGKPWEAVIDNISLPLPCPGKGSCPSVGETSLA